MKVLSLNCQKNYNSSLRDFFHGLFATSQYDVFLLQEATDEVIDIIPDDCNYQLVRHQNGGLWGLTAILFNNQHYTLVDSGYQSFDFVYKEDQRLGHISYGATFARLQRGKEYILVCSMHLPAGLSSQIRRNCLQEAKKYILQNSEFNDQIIFGGDCNFGFPGEYISTSCEMSPEFIHVTRNIEPTLDSYYTEHLNYITSHVAYVLRMFGLSIKLRTDHFFTDAQTGEHCAFAVLPDRVSDHSPIELSVT